MQPTGQSQPPRRSSFDKLMDLYWGGTERRISALTLRIIAINALSLIVLMFGITSLGRYENDLLTTKLMAFSENAQLITQLTNLTPPENRQALLNWLAQTKNQRIVHIDTTGTIISQSDPQSTAPPRETPISIQTLRAMTQWALKTMPQRKTLPQLPENLASRSDIITAINNAQPAITAWMNSDDKLILTASAPLYDGETLIGALHFERAGDDITQSITNFWGQMLKIFALTLIITITISIYLAGTIARPLRKLMRAAEIIRRDKSAQVEIPDFSARHDEIGELSLVMRDMTESLRQRMTVIESFAADVTHELKNPLTSLKSAVETLKIAKKDKDRQALLNVLHHDMDRMDRLINDIAATSRLDSELSRLSPEPIDIATIASAMVGRYQNQYPNITFKLNTPYEAEPRIQGLSGRINQVLDNVLSNAVSFANDDDTITCTITPSKHSVTVEIQDQGPGIPDSKLETIFNRFYSQRPEKDNFGNHSGLGLAICKQIVTALGGKIQAQNVKTPEGKTIGARFIIEFNKA